MQLRHSTVAQARTLTDLQYEIVLSNLAMFKQDQNALPWHVDVISGQMAVDDQVGPTFAITWPMTTRTFSFSPSRRWAGFWEVEPVTDRGRLEKLREIYKEKANASWLEEGLAPLGKPFGRYGMKYVWVKAGSLEELTALTLEILGTVEMSPPKQKLIFPGSRLPPARR